MPPCALHFARAPRSSPRPLHRNTSAKRTMRWPGSGTEDEKKKPSSESWLDSLRLRDWRPSLIDPQTVITSIALTITSVGAVRVYKTYLRRIPSVNHIKPHYFRRKGLFGRVTSVGDADNFRLYHTPGGRLAGWGWLPWKRVPVKREGLSNQTVGSDYDCVSVHGARTQYVRPLSKDSCTFESLASMLQNLPTGVEKRSRMRKKLTNGL